jgi:hypothetical protein
LKNEETRMILSRKAVVAVLAMSAVSAMFGAQAMACDTECDSQRIKNQLREIHEREVAVHAAQALAAYETAREFETAVAPFEALASAYDAIASRYFKLRARFYNRVQYDLGAYLEPLIREGIELDEDTMAAYNSVNAINSDFREKVSRGRATPPDRAPFTKSFTIREQSALQSGIISLSVASARFELIVQGLENDEIGRAMLGLPSDEELKAREDAAAKKAKKRRHR